MPALTTALGIRLGVAAAAVLAGLVAPRWFGHRARGALFGDARFATRREIEASGLYGQDGIVIGKAHGRHLVFGGQQFVLIAAPTRSGKGVGIVIPNLLTFAGSAVVLDIKGENFEKTAAYRASKGQAVFRFNPFSAESACFNPLAEISDDPNLRFGEALALATALYPRTAKDPFWADQAANLFVGLALYLCETPILPRTFTYMLEILRSVPGITDARKAAGRLAYAGASKDPPLSEACSGALKRFAGTSEGASAGVMSAFYTPLLVFADPHVARATASSDFSMSDVRRRATTIYVCVDPQHLKSARVLINLFFTQLIFKNTNKLADHNGGLQCLLLMDEFTSIGRVDILAHSIAFMAGYNLRLVTIVQSLAQLIGVYGEHDARTLISNHACRVVFAPNELRDARDISDTLGTMTVKTVEKSHSTNQGSMRRSMTSRIAVHSRPLLLPQELRALGANRELVLLSDHAPILAEKIRYFSDPDLMNRATEQKHILRTNAA